MMASRQSVAGMAAALPPPSRLLCAMRRRRSSRVLLRTASRRLSGWKSAQGSAAAATAIPRVSYLASALARRWPWLQHSGQNGGVCSSAATLAAGAQIYLNFISLQQQDMENYQKYYKGSTDMEYYRMAASRYNWFRKLQL